MKSPFILLTAIVLVMACRNNPKPADPGIPPELLPPDTSRPVITTSFTDTIYPPIFEAAFHEGTKVAYSTVTYNFFTYRPGKITIESGKVIACDPIVMRDAIPFSYIFPTGDYPVELAMAKTDNDERVAFSRIVLSANPVVKWEQALKDGQKPLPLGDTTIYCYGVDAGMGMFVDAVANNYFKEKSQSDWEYIFIENTKQPDYKGYIYNLEGHNLATFRTGYGDGCYATYIGYDSTGKACRLLTDFGLVEWWRVDKPPTHL